MNRTVKVSTFAKAPGVYRLRAEMPRLAGEPRKQQTRTIRCSPRELKTQEAAYLLEMQAVADQQLNAAGLLAPAVRAPVTLQAYAQDWLEQRRQLGSFAHNTLSQYRTLITHHIIPTWGSLEVSQVTRPAVLAGFAALSGKGLAPATLQHIRARLAALLADAASEGLEVAAGAMSKLPLPRAEQTVNRVLSEENTRKLLEALEGHRLGPILRCMMTTGLRRGEACGLQWGDLDLDAGTITVRRVLSQIDNGPVVVKPPKTRSSRRVVHMSKAGVGAFRIMRARAEETARVLGHDVAVQPVFLSGSGEAWRPSQLTQAVATLREQIGLPELTVHGLRHAHATSLLRLRHNVKAVAKRLGHSDPALTLRIYAHVIGDDDAALADEAERKLALLQKPETRHA